MNKFLNCRIVSEEIVQAIKHMKTLYLLAQMV